ncbi:MAG: hypothetical protein P8P36_04540 [Akkermansiaceae bacterium]|nr:hypothetical protein [Akkermansiaceae bacterium]
MKHKKSWLKSIVVAVVSAMMLSSCVTSYDRSGRPIQTVDPAAAVVGAVLIGAIAYSSGKDNDNHRRHGYHRPRRQHGCY